MKVGRDYNELIREIERRANAKVDVIAKTDALGMYVAAEGGVPAQVRLNIADEHDVSVNGIAHDQIGTYCGIGGKYYDRMLAEAPELLTANVNHWFHQIPAEAKDCPKQMVRMLDGTARAFLSDKYRRLDNEELAQAVIPALREAGADIMSCEVTDRRLYIKAVDQSVTRELTAKGGTFGDGQHNIVRLLAPAVTISNSEVGYGALGVLGGVYDEFCSNLATFGERSARKYHVGAKHDLGEDIYALLTDETRVKTDSAFWAQIGDVVRAAFDRAKFDSLCGKIAETQTHKIEGEPEKVVTLTSRKLGLTEAEGKVTLRHLLAGNDMSRFGLYNAITRAAQDVESYDRATEMERIGAQVIELPAKDWKPILQAA